MLTRLETTSGKLAVSAIKPAAMTNAKVAAGEKRNASNIAITMGVRINAAPSLANRADTAAPSRTINANSLRVLPPPHRATCSAAHLKKPASSSSRLMMMTAMKVPVAFQTMRQTSGMSARVTTPASNATMAPNIALQPTPSPLGCQMTRTMVAIKINTAISISLIRLGVNQLHTAWLIGRSFMPQRRLASVSSHC